MFALPLREKDLAFVVNNAAAPAFEDKAKLKRFITEDESFRKGLVGSEKVYQKVTGDEAFALGISPELFFEILLRRACHELETSTHTRERIGTLEIPVFDAERVAKFLESEPVLLYLANMLASFIKIESFVLVMRVRKGIWRKKRFNNMDIDALEMFCQALEPEERFGLYKRIADVCLFIPGIFPEFVHQNYFYPFSGEKRPALPDTLQRRSLEDFEKEGKKYYRLAMEHRDAGVSGMAEPLKRLDEGYPLARKALNFLSHKYLYFKKRGIFELDDRQ